MVTKDDGLTVYENYLRDLGLLIKEMAKESKQAMDDKKTDFSVARKIAIVVFSKLAVVGFCSFSIVFPLCHRRKIFTSQIAVGVFTTRRRKTLSHKNRKS